MSSSVVAIFTKAKLALLGLLFIVMILGVVYHIENNSYKMAILSEEEEEELLHLHTQHSESLDFLSPFSSFTNTAVTDAISSAEDFNSKNNVFSEGAYSHRQLSTDFNYFTGESQNTYNGKVPKTTCDAGYYRPQGSTDLNMVSGQREDGCVPCPAGRYGAVAGLSSPLCTGGCPLGTYSDSTGLTSPLQCAFCPVGKWGQFGGLTTKDCTGNCPAGRYTSTVGNTFRSDCKICPPGFRSWQCVWAVAPMHGQVQDHLKSGLGSGVVSPVFGYKDKFLDPIPN